MKVNRNDKLLSDFLNYCVKHPYQTFHHALRDWERKRSCAGEQANQGSSNPGEYYRQKTEEAEAWRKLRDYGIIHCLPSTVLRQLETHLDSARFVGD